MRTTLATILVTIGLLAAQAQDIIVKSGGDTMKVYDLKVGTKFITYRLTPDEKPARRISKTKVRSIKKEQKDSATDIIHLAAAVDTATTIITKAERRTGEIERPASIDNRLLINKYNIRHDRYGNKKESNKATDCAIAIMAVTDSSILANEDIEIRITPYGKPQDIQAQYSIYIHNRSDKNIYLDFENSFRIYNDGSFRTFYINKEITQNRKSNESLIFTEKIKRSYHPTIQYKRKEWEKGGKYNSGKSRSTSHKIKGQKIATIPPGGKLQLPARIFLDSNDEIIKRYERFGFTLNRNINIGQTISFKESDTPYRSSFIVRYSHDKKFTGYTTVKFDIYAKEIIGIKRKGFDANRIYNYDNHTIYSEVTIK